MRVLVLGAGAIGGYFGARLIEAGHDVSFLVRPATAQRLRRDGLRVQSPNGDFARPVDAIVRLLDGAPCDLALLSCKAYDLDSAVAAIAPAIGPDTRVLPLLNGLRHLDVLDLAFGRERVWGGLAHISVTLADDGTVRQLGKLDRLTFGVRGPDARLETLAQELLTLRVELRRRHDILAAMWEKFVFIATLAGMTCLMRGSVGEIVAAPGGAALICRAYAEACAIAAAEGYAVTAEAREEAEAILAMRDSPLKASMLRDLEHGARTEVEHVIGDLLERGRRHGVDRPLIEAACAHLRVYETSR